MLKVESACRRPQDVSAVFLYRKVPAVPSKAVVLEAPIVGASEKMMDEWLPAYLRALDQVDADTEDGEPGESYSIPLSFFTTPPDPTSLLPHHVDRDSTCSLEAEKPSSFPSSFPWPSLSLQS